MNVRAGLLAALAGPALAACGTSHNASTAPPPTVARYSVADFYKNTEYFGASFSPDRQKILVSLEPSGIWNAYAVPVAGGEPRAADELDDELDLRVVATSRTTAASSTRATRAATS